jgi:hypothetical protein
MNEKYKKISARFSDESTCNLPEYNKFIYLSVPMECHAIAAFLMHEHDIPFLKYSRTFHSMRLLHC